MSYYRIHIDAQTETVADLRNVLALVSEELGQGVTSHPDWRLLISEHTIDAVSGLRYQISDAIEQFEVVNPCISRRIRERLEDIEADDPDDADLDMQYAAFTELLREIEADRKEYGIPEGERDE